VCLAVEGEEPDGVGVGLLFSASSVRRKLRLRARRCPRGNEPPMGVGCASGMFPHIRVWWSGWLRAACSGSPSEGPSVPLLSRGFVLVVGTAGFEPATPCSQSRCADQTAPRPVETAAGLRFLLLGGAEAVSIALQHHLTGGHGAASPEPRLPDLARSFERHLRAENESHHGRDLPETGRSTAADARDSTTSSLR
jgi:hypothetical protein